MSKSILRKHIREILLESHKVIAWISEGGYDSILITEDGITNYLTWGKVIDFREIEKQDFYDDED